MKKLVLTVVLVLALSGLACAMNVDSKLVDVMKTAKGLIPVIVEMNPGAKHVDVAALGGKLKDTWTVINGFSADLPIAAINALQKNPNVRAISYDSEVKVNLNIARQAIEAVYLHNEGYDGDGVTIAIVDTGIYPHTDLSGRIIGFKDFVNGRTAAYDDHGHGTHLAGCAAGAGATYRGIAPHAKLVGVKVLTNTGSGTTSTIISGINWVVTYKATYNIKVLSLSLGGTITQSSTIDPLCSAVRSAWNAGLVVCVAAGNSGPNSSTISTPGNEPLVITVGATDDHNTPSISDDTLASFSSRGPTAIDGWAKPDLLAPGVNIISLKNATTGYVSMSGTSIATPMIAGVAACYLEANPTSSPATVKSNMKASCASLGYSVYAQGSGLINAYYTVH